MKIGELAAKSGVATSTIRFYERSGLLPPARRGGNGYRMYGAEDVERLRQITIGQALGFSLDAMRSVYSAAEGFSKEELIARLDTRLAEIEELQAALRAQRVDLQALRETLLSTWSRGDCVDIATATEGLTAGKPGGAAKSGAASKSGAAAKHGTAPAAAHAKTARRAVASRR